MGGAPGLVEVPMDDRGFEHTGLSGARKRRCGRIMGAFATEAGAKILVGMTEYLGDLQKNGGICLHWMKAKCSYE